MSEVGVTRDQIDIVRWTSSSDLGRRAAALLQRQNYGEGGKTVMKGVDLLGVPVGLLSVTFPDLPEGLKVLCATEFRTQDIVPRQFLLFRT